MKTITNNLSRVILAIAAVALIVGVVLSLAAPIGSFFSGTFGKLNEVGNGDMWELGGYNPGGEDPGSEELLPGYYNVSLLAAPAYAGTATFANTGLSTMSLTGENTVGLNATENAGYYFQGWYGSDATLLSVNRSYSPTVYSETTMTAVYLEPGLYDADGNLLADWDKLTNTYGLDIEKDYLSDFSDDHYLYSQTHPYLLMRLNEELSTGTRLVIPDGITKIGDHAFRASLLTEITIPDSVTTLGIYSLAASRLTSMVFGENSPITSIPDYCFYGAKSLEYVSLPDGITSIGNYAFMDCDSLTNVGAVGSNASVEWPDSITSIGNRVFSNCDNLIDVDIPSQVTSIGSEAFYRCVGLTEIVIPSQVTSIGSKAFCACNNVESITVASGNTKYHSAGNCLIDTENKVLLTGCNNSVIPNDGSVTSIDTEAFYGCTELTNIQIPDGVTTIGYLAFSMCKGLTSIGPVGSGASVEIPDSVTTIVNNAFSGCSNLTNVIFPKVTTINQATFTNCTKLTSVTIPNSVVSICGDAFKNCEKLTNITFEGTMAQWNAIAKAADWNEYTGTYTITCTDGTISK